MTENEGGAVIYGTVEDRLDLLEKQVKAILGVMGWMDLKVKPECKDQKAHAVMQGLRDLLAEAAIAKAEPGKPPDGGTGVRNIEI